MAVLSTAQRENLYARIRAAKRDKKRVIKLKYKTMVADAKERAKYKVTEGMSDKARKLKKPMPTLRARLYDLVGPAL